MTRFSALTGLNLDHKGEPAARAKVTDGDFVAIGGGFGTHRAMALRSDGAVRDLRG